jgi:predicted secreted hydrolase
MKVRSLIFSAITFFTVLTIGCGSNSTPNAPLVALPADEGPHDTAIEWWYFNGLFTDDHGQEYSYHYVTFQNKATGTAVPHLLQASLGVHGTGEHLTGERVLLDVLDPDAVGVDVEVDGWEMLGDGEFYSLEFDLGDYALDLKAIPTRPPILHQGVGLVSLGPVGDTFYYSRTRLDLTGSITVDGQQRTVTGTTWMDHQWGDVVGQKVGWDWASVQLDDGSDLMAVLVWDPADRTPFAGYGTLVSPDGTVTKAKQADVSISSSAIWTSPETGIEYPSGWTITIPTLGLSLELEPVLVNAEFANSRFTPAAYWEGEVTATGTRQGQAVGGRGFVELVGYDPSQIEPTPTP